LEIEGLVASVDGGRMVREKKRASVDKPEEVGVSLAEILLAQGGEEILSAVYEAR